MYAFYAYLENDICIVNQIQVIWKWIKRTYNYNVEKHIHQSLQ